MNFFYLCIIQTMEPSIPIQRCKSGWLKEHEKHMAESRVSTADVVLIGDSIVRHFEKYRYIGISNIEKLYTLDYLVIALSMFFGG